MEYKMTTDLRVGDRVRSTVDRPAERVEAVLPFVNAQNVAQAQWRLVCLSMWTAVPGADYGTLSFRRVRATVDYEWCVKATVTTGKVSA